MAESGKQFAHDTVKSSTLYILFSVVFLDNLGYAIVLPYLYYYAQSLGASDITYGLILTSYSLLSLIFTPIVARLSDRLGRRKILLVALGVASFAYFAFGIANVLWLLFAARMLSGTTAATVPVAQAYMADITTKKNRLRYLGLLSAAAGIAFIMGPAIGGTLSSSFGYAVPSFAASLLALGNLISAYFKLPEPECPPEQRGTSFKIAPFRDIFKKKTIRLLLLLYFLFFTAFVFLQAALPPWLKTTFGFGAFETGLIFFYIGGISVFTQAVLLPKISQKTSQTTLLLLGIVTLAIGCFALGLLQNLSFFFVVTAVTAFGFGGQILVLNTLISVNTPTEAQGGTLGIAWAIAALAQTVAPVLAASAFAFGSSNGVAGLPFLISAAIAFCTIPLMLSFKRAVKD